MAIYGKLTSKKGGIFMLDENKYLNQIEEIKYLAQENTARYRAIMRFFFNKYEEAEYWLYKEQVYDSVKKIINDYKMEECERDLEFLIINKSLTRIQDTKNVTTIKDFKYHNFRYQMTDKAVIIERTTIELENIEVKVANLEPRLFERIYHLLKQLNIIYTLDENKIYELWIDINTDFKNLNEQYQDFLKKFHEAKTEELLQSETFLEFKSSMINYITNFINSYIKCASNIKSVLMEIDNDKEKYLMDSLISHQKKAPKISPEFDYEKLRHVNLGKWNSLKKWFVVSSGMSEGERLLEATQNVIEKIYKYASSLMELHGNMINRKEDYKHICHLFDNVSSIDDARKLSSLIFGITEVRHYSNYSMLNTDSLINSYDVLPTEISINTSVKQYKVKAVNSYIVDKTEEKEALLNKIELEDKVRKDKIRNLIKKGEIILDGKVNLDIIERRYVLNLIEKYQERNTRETEFGYLYSIEEYDKSKKCQIISPDGVFELTSRLIKINK